MPNDWSFYEVFDFYFKAHKVFNLKFEPVVENAMIFIQTYFYHLFDGSKSPTQPMKELIHSLQIDIDAQCEDFIENE